MLSQQITQSNSLHEIWRARVKVGLESSVSKFIGEWVDSEGNRLIITKQASGKTVVSFLRGADSVPITRPYYGGRPSTEMCTRLRDYGSTMEVDLWIGEKGFVLHLTYEHAYEFDKNRRDSLVPGLSRRQEDSFLEEYYHLFGSLKHYTKTEA